MVGIFWTSRLGDRILNNPERIVLRRQGREPGYIGVSLQGAVSLNVKILLLIKENQTTQVNEFNTSLCVGRCRSLGSVK